MSRIICPYCCRHFEPDEVHFRYKEATRREAPVQHEEEEITFRRRGGSRNELTVRNDGRVLDQQLFKYYKEFGSPADSGNFENYSMQLPFIEFDRLNPKITYDFAAFEEYGFINKIRVDGQMLDERLCPFCHNRVVEGAGKQDMHMISVIGNTSAGKSVYLAILSKIIGEDKALNASIFFKGNEEEEEYYFKNYKSLIKENRRLNATNGIVPPIPFEINFTDSITGQKRSVMIVFRDIMGESVQNLRDLGLSGKHIKESSALLYLLDPTGFNEVIAKVTKRSYDGGSQAESLTALKRYLTGDEYEEQTSIPTAIVIAKSDIISSMSFFDDGRYTALVEDENWRSRYSGYIEPKRIEASDEGVKDFLRDIDEEQYVVNAEDTFKNHKFFMSSSLGYDPDANVNNWTDITPFNVTEPFYWLLSELGVLPCRITRKYTNKKQGTKELSVLGYKSDTKEQLDARFEEELKQQGMISMLPWNKWIPEGVN